LKGMTIERANAAASELFDREYEQLENQIALNKVPGNRG
jgi:hypothetical protein